MWLVERNVRIHGTFRSEVALDFDEYNAKAEAFFFARTHAIPPESSENKFKNKVVIIDGSSDSDHTKVKKIYSMGSGNNSLNSKLIEKRREKGKTLMMDDEKYL